MQTSYNSGYPARSLVVAKLNPSPIPGSATTTALSAFDISPASNMQPLFQSSNYSLPSFATGATAFDLAGPSSVGGGVQQLFSVLSVIVGTLAQIMKANEGGTTSTGSTGVKKKLIDNSDSQDIVPKKPKSDTPTPSTSSADATPGDTVKGDTKQGQVGDCFFLSAARAMSETDQGKQLIDQAVKSNSDGSFDVSFKGATKSYHVSKDDLNDKYASGDPVMQALCAAGDQYFKDQGNPNGIAAGADPRSVYQLLDGGAGKEHDIEPSRSGDGPSKDDIKKYLTDVAPQLGKNTALTLIGTVDKDGNWAPTDPSGGHVFQISNINTATGDISYTNPWDTSIKRTIKIDDLVNQMNKDGKDNGALIGRTF